MYFYESENADHNILDHHIRNHAGDIPDDVLILKVNLSSHDDLKELHEVTSSQTFVQIDNQGGLLKKWHGGSTLNDVLKEIEPETSSREEILVIGEASACPSRLLIGDTTGNVLGRWYIYSLE